MNHYRQSITLFGIVLPVLAIVLLAGICLVIRSKMSASLASNQALFITHETSRRKAIEIETKVVRQREHFDRWTALLAEEPSSSVNANLRSIADGLPTKEFQKTAYERTAGSGGLGSATAQASSQHRLVFRGTFRTMQRAFLELESRMPQLQLQELHIEPNQNQQNPSPLLNFQVTYTAWEN